MFIGIETLEDMWWDIRTSIPRSLFAAALCLPRQNSQLSARAHQGHAYYVRRKASGSFVASVPGLPRSHMRIYLSACSTRIVAQERFMCAPHALINCAYVNERGRPGTEASSFVRGHS